MKMSHSWLFWLGLALRLCCLPLFGSHYLTELFIPFLDKAVLNPGENPWNLMPPQFFPYGSFLFALMYLPRQLAFWVFGPAVLGSGAVGLALAKAPLLVIELFLLRALAQRTPQPRLLLLYYWLNPVLLYISYIHGQFDAVVTACTALSLLWLIEQRIAVSALALACAASSKFSAVVAAPLMLAYLWNREFPPQAVRKIALWIGVFIAASLVGFFPLFTAGKFAYTSVASPEALRLLAARIDFGSGTSFYLGLALVLAMLGRLCVSTRISSAALLYGTGLIYGLLVVATNTMPGWYYWPLPFIALLYANHHNAPRFPFYLAHAAYLLNFVMVPAVGLPQILSHEQWLSVVFTLLQTSMLSLLLVIWVVSLREEAKLERYIRPLMIGVAGDSAAGKNRLSGALSEVFGGRSTVMLEGDDYHKWERGDDRYLRYTHLSPRANNLKVLDQHTRQLIEGRLVLHHQYDHGTGRFAKARAIKASKTVIVQGLHTLYLRATRRTFDLKVFLDPDELVKLAWKVSRDVKERGHDLSAVLASLDARRRDAMLHIAPQREYADWIIEALPREKITREEVLAGRVPAIVMRHVFWNDADIEAFLDALSRCHGVRFSVERVSASFDRVALTIDGEPPLTSIKAMAEELFQPVRHLTRSTQAPQWRAGYDGLTQLLALTLLRSNASSLREEGSYGLGQVAAEPRLRDLGAVAGESLPFPEAGDDLASGA